MWKTISTPYAVHVVPVCDTHVHELNALCFCLPGLDDRYARVVFEHRSFDGREADEERITPTDVQRIDC